MTETELVEIRDAYLPSQGEAFDVLAFGQAVAAAAELERDRYRNGNTELLGLWLKLLDGQDIIDVQERVREILTDAGLLRDGKPDWTALEARKPKQRTWAEAVNECITDPAERARLLAMGD